MTMNLDQFSDFLAAMTGQHQQQNDPEPFDQPEPINTWTKPVRLQEDDHR